MIVLSIFFFCHYVFKKPSAAEASKSIFMRERVKSVARKRKRMVQLKYFVLLTGIEGAFSGAGAKTVIPRKVIGKFSIRLVPDMQPDTVEKLVREHVKKVHEARGSPNEIK